jgi:predicted acetyltransferase
VAQYLRAIKDENARLQQIITLQDDVVAGLRNEIATHKAMVRALEVQLNRPEQDAQPPPQLDE